MRKKSEEHWEQLPIMNPSVTGLSDQDRAFLERTRNRMKQSLVLGWLFLFLPFVLGAVLFVNRGRAIDRFNAIQEPLFEKLAEENTQLESLHPTTSLERQLVQHALEKNARILVVMKGCVVSTVIVLLVWIVHGLLSAGFSILGRRKTNARWLRIVDALEQRSHG